MGSSAGLFQLVGAVGGMAATGANAYTQSNAMRAQGNYARTAGNMNAGSYDLMAQDAIRRGDLDAQRLGLQTRKLIASQRVSAAAQGVEVNSGSPLALQANAAALSALDQSTLRNNAMREAMGLRMSAANQRFQGDMAYRTGAYNSQMTSLGGGLSMLQQGGRAAYDYYRYTPPMTVPIQATKAVNNGLDSASSMLPW